MFQTRNTLPVSVHVALTTISVARMRKCWRMGEGGEREASEKERGG